LILSGQQKNFPKSLPILGNPFFFHSQDQVFDLTNAVEHLSDGIAIFSFDGECLYVNHALSKLINVHRESNKTHFSTIQNCLFILKGEANDRSDLQEYLSTGLDEVKRLSGIVDRLREAYRPSLQTDSIPVNPLEIIENVLTLLKSHLQHQRIHWVITGAKDCQIVVHVDSMKQVFINLVHNAIDAMTPDGGTLTIDIKKHPDGSKVGIYFHDTGRGISAEDLPNIFDPFYTTRDMGFGLGLPICQDIIKNHGGSIRVESHPGIGSTFSVWLPGKIEMER
jgi:signal transduction histidine kinase